MTVARALTDASLQDTFNATGTTSPIEGIEIKVERRYTYTTESGKQVEIPDLECGEER